MSIELKSILENLGITCDEVEGGYIFTLGFEQNNNVRFPLTMFTWTAGDDTEHVRLIIAPYIEKPTTGYSLELLRFVLHANDDMPDTKFLIDEEGDLALALDIHIEYCNADTIQAAIDNIGSYGYYYLGQIE